MSQLLNPATFEFAAQYFLAGFIIIFVRSRYVGGVRPKAAERLVEAVVLSLINQLIALLISTMWLLAFAPFPDRIGLVAEVLILPCALGYLFGRDLKDGWNNGALRLLAMPVSSPSLTAYDFAMAKEVANPKIVIITYGDGSRIAGYLGPHSYASDTEDRNDIYLEFLYEEEEDGSLKASDPPRPALIWLDGARSIEFLDP
ncbi:MAG: DUF6338 family protein [Pseudomonadota bacterium]